MIKVSDEFDALRRAGRDLTITSLTFSLAQMFVV